MKPLAESINTIARDAARISSLATSQVERIDRLVTDLTNRVEQTATTVHAVLKPLRDGAAVIVGREGGDRRISRAHAPFRRESRPAPRTMTRYLLGERRFRDSFPPSPD